MDMDISMDIHAKSVDMDMDINMDGNFISTATLGFFANLQITTGSRALMKIPINSCTSNAHIVSDSRDFLFLKEQLPSRG